MIILNEFGGTPQILPREYIRIYSESLFLMLETIDPQSVMLHGRDEEGVAISVYQLHPTFTKSQPITR